MKVLSKLSLITLMSFCGMTSAQAYDQDRTHFYIGMDASKVEGSVEGRKVFLNGEHDMKLWGLTAGYEFNKMFSIDAFYNEETDVDLKNYGLRFNARPVIYGPIYAVGTLGLNRTDFVGKGRPLTNDPNAPDYDDKGKPNYERHEDNTGIDVLYGVGLGYRYQQVDFEVKYIDYADFDGIMGSLMVRF